MTFLSHRPIRVSGLALLLTLVSCSPGGDTIRLTAPFNNETKVGEVSAVWRNTGETRAFAGGTRLKEPEVRFQYRADVRNRLSERLFVRLGDLQLVTADGLALATDPATVTCTLNAGTTEGVLAGDLWLAQSQASAVRHFQLAHFAVPLSERGRALYREALLQSRPGQSAEIDAELTQYAAAPPCAQPH